MNLPARGGQNVPAATQPTATPFVLPPPGGGGSQPPTVVSVSPLSGPTGTSIIITGTNLTYTQVVEFAGGVHASFNVDHDSELSLKVPDGAKTGKITVTTDGGTAASPRDFTVESVPTGGGGGYKWSHNDLENLWISQGGANSASDIAAAVAQAESGGCQYALAGPKDTRPQKVCTWNRTTKENSCGLWQINLDAHPTYHAPGIYDAKANARAAVAIANGGTDFSAWTMYTNGEYKKYLTGQQGDPGGGGGGPGEQPGAGVSSAWSEVIKVYGKKTPKMKSQVSALADQFGRLFQ